MILSRDLEATNFVLFWMHPAGTDLEEIIHRINDCIEKYNAISDQPYKFGFSMGYAMYDFHSHIKAEAFQKQIDVLLYNNKQANKEINSKEWLSNQSGPHA